MLPSISILLGFAAVVIAYCGDVSSRAAFWSMWLCCFAAILLLILSVGVP